MAGNFTINVVVSGGAGGGGGTGGGSASESDISATSAVAGFAAGLTKPQEVDKMLAALNSAKFNEQGGLVSGTSKVTFFDRKTGDLKLESSGTVKSGPHAGKPIHRKEHYNLLHTRKQVREQGWLKPAKVSIAGVYATMPDDYLHGVDTGIQQVTATFDYGYGRIQEHLIANKDRYKALTTVALYKTIGSSIAVTKHQSGDSYYNQQLSNVVKSATYIGAIALAGPSAGFVAAGIVVNELADIATGLMTFNFDRKIERHEITNNMIAAGNASYGRMRGVGV
jgi:hypothetical protein